MEFVKLAHTDLVVSRLVFGCEPLGGTDWGNFDRDLARRAVSHALDLGVNIFDTADVYGLGESERTLSAALGERRHDVVIVSKFGVNWQRDAQGGRARTFRDSSPQRVVQALENSLRRLRIDCLPLYLVHWPDPDTPVGETMEALLECQRAGKIKYIGVSNFTARWIRQARSVANLAVAEMPYNLIDRRAEGALLPCCESLGLSVLVYGPLAQGLLTGKYGRHARFDHNDRRSRLAHFQGEELARHLKTIDRLSRVARRYGKTPAQTAIRWVLDHPAVSCAIVGIKTPRQLEENLGALDWTLESKEWAFLGESSLEGVSYVS